MRPRGGPPPDVPARGSGRTGCVLGTCTCRHGPPGHDLRPPPSPKWGIGDNWGMNFTPLRYSLATPADFGGTAGYQRFCRAVGLDAISGGWGFLHCEDDVGDRWTLLTTDVGYLRMLARAGPARLDIPAGKFPRWREGWPEDWVA